MVVNIEITTGKGEAAVSKVYTVDSDDTPLILLEAAQTGDAKVMREAIADFLGLSAEESRALTVRHTKAISNAIKEANDAPNG